MSLKCVSFGASLLSLTVDGVTPPDFDPRGSGFTAVVASDTARVTLEGSTVQPETALTVYAGGDSSGTVLASGAGTVTVPGVPLSPGDNYFYILVTALGPVTRGYALTVFRRTNDAKAIRSFSIISPVTAAGIINEAAKTVTVDVPHGTDLSAMTTSITHTGVAINPASGTARNFSSPQTYTVTAADGTQQAYTVTVRVKAQGAKAITAFSITSPVTAAGIINEAAKTIAVTVPYGTNLNAMTTSITHTGVAINPASGAARNFSSPQTYTVTAADGTQQVYTVTVTVLGQGTVTIQGPPDETVTLTPVNNHSRIPPTDLSYAAGDTVTFTVSGSYTAVGGDLRWYVDGTQLTGTGNSLTIAASNYIKRSYTLTVMVKKNGLWYSTDTGFRVID
jgi:hypothetical protein